MLKMFFSFYKPYKGLFLLDMFCTVLVAAVELAFPVATRYALNDLIGVGAFPAFFWVMAALFVGYLVRAALQYVISYWGHTMGVFMECDIKRTLFAHMQKLPCRFYDQNRTGQLMSRVTSDLFEIVELAHHGPEDVLLSAVELVGAIVIMWTLQWQMALLLLIMAPIMFAFTLWRRKKMAKSAHEVKDKIGVINSDIESSISGARVAKAFANEAHEMKKFEGGNEKYRAARRTFYREMALFHSGMEFFSSIFQVAVIAMGGWLILCDGMQPEDLLTFSLYVGTFVAPIRRLANFAEQYSVGMAGFKRFYELMNTAPEIADKDDALVLSDVKGDVEYKGVTFSYNDGDAVLSDLSMTVQAGKTVALVGPSGGGKTTLCHLLTRFYEAEEGTITVDGIDIRDVTMESLRKTVGIVQQEVMLFADTIRENIRYGRLDATDEEVEEAARLAEIHDDILQMPDGYDTFVGERGLRLSGGQKQRVSIARIFLKNPSILILDEATSALDTITEAKIQKSFERLSENRTTLVIAHRLSTIRHADRIVYIDGDGIREQGSHEELLEQNGLYAALYNAIRE